MNQIQVENQIDKIVMPDNLKVGLMVADQREKCASGGCTDEYYGLGFGQSPFHVPHVLSKALADSSGKGHYSAAEGILELREAIAGFNKRHFGLDVEPNRIVIGPGTRYNQYNVWYHQRGCDYTFSILDWVSSSNSSFTQTFSHIFLETAT